MSNFVVIIPAAGIGERFNSKLPKQYTSIGDSSILEKTVSKFLSQDYIKKVIISVSSNDSFYQSLNFITNPKVHIVTGGDSRMESVCNAMHEVDSNEFPLTIIHDAVRPFFSINLLNEQKLIQVRLRSRKSPGEPFVGLKKYKSYWSDNIISRTKRFLRPFKAHRLIGTSTYYHEEPDKIHPDIVKKIFFNSYLISSTILSSFDFK